MTGDLFFAGGDMADPNWLVGFTNDTGPVPYYPYYLYDRATRRARFLFDHRPELSSYELAPMGPFSFAARDGSTIHGYATFPLGAEPPAGGAERARRPLGPGQLGFDPEAQWTAIRGLSVQAMGRQDA